MKISRADFQALRGHLLALLLAIVGGVAALGFSFGAAQEAKRVHAAAQKAHDEIDGKRRRIHSQESAIRAQAALFAGLQAQGIVGEERRLDWIEGLKEFSERQRSFDAFKVFDMRYEFSPRRVLEPPLDGGATFHASALQWQAGLLHEGDLLRLLDELAQNAKALLQVKRCRLSRLPDDGEKSLKARLHADCLFDWITIAPPGGEPLEKRP